jgi:signal peptidase I
MIFRWFLSKTVREACTVHRHYRRQLTAQRDLLAAPAVEAVQAALDKLKASIQGGENKGAVRLKAEEAQFAGEKWLKGYPNPGWRENVEVLLVALAVAMAIRTFFLQPFKIPTGSMQPTLFGVTSKNYLAHGNAEKFDPPTGWLRVKEWFAGTSYVNIIAENEGQIEGISKPFGIKIFNFWQDFKLGGKNYRLWFPPDFGEGPQGMNALAYRAGWGQGGHVYRKGEPVVQLRMNAGDHLFVDRLMYNFRKPERGEIIVFQTKGITHPAMPQDQFYIKRLVVLPGEKVQIGDDRHLVINGERLDASVPHFENVYGFNPKQRPGDSQFSGHVNGAVAQANGLYSSLAPLFPDGQVVYENPADAYMVMGDNTCNSFDSRGWGGFPAQNVIGKSFFVYWPITERFGWGNN